MLSLISLDFLSNQADTKMKRITKCIKKKKLLKYGTSGNEIKGQTWQFLDLEKNPRRT
jgi:hypothetical protein